MQRAVAVYLISTC